MRAFARRHKRLGPNNNTSSIAEWSPTVKGGYWAYNNIWNEGALVIGTNYTSGQTVNQNTFPNDTLISWDFGTHDQTTDNVWGYPEIVFGGEAGNMYFAPPNGGNPPAVQIKNLTALTASLDYAMWAVNGLDNFDVLMETTLTSDSSGQVGACEFAFYLHTPSYMSAWFGTTVGVPGGSGLPLVAYSAGSYNGMCWIGTNGSWPFLVFRQLGSPDFTSGVIDINAALTWAVSNGYLTGNEYIWGYEFGVEPKVRDGNLLVQKLQYNFNGTVY